MMTTFLTLAASVNGAAAPPASSIGWVAAANLIIWTGIFLYLLRLAKRLRELEKNQ